MTYSKVVISSGHSNFVSGAVGYINEITEARKVVDKVHEYLIQLGVSSIKYHDNTTKTQKDNVNGIVAYHNKQSRELDVSVHFNAHKTTNSPMGVEVLHYNANTKQLSDKVSKAIADVSGLKNRGAKVRDNLGFLKRTNKPAILIEICFVDSKADVEVYNKNFDKICKAIAEVISGKKLAGVKSSFNVDDKVYRLFTGTFPTKSQAELAAQKITEATGLQIRIREE